MPYCRSASTKSTDNLHSSTTFPKYRTYAAHVSVLILWLQRWTIGSRLALLTKSRRAQNGFGIKSGLRQLHRSLIYTGSPWSGAADLDHGPSDCYCAAAVAPVEGSLLAWTVVKPA
jgi:hypothetical protein